MPTMAERTAMIAAIAALPDALERAVAGLNDAQLDTPYRDGGWTVREVVHHLADSHMNAFLRMKWMLLEENFTVKPYDQDRWAASPECWLPVGPALLLVRGLHERWTAMLSALTTEGEWNRSAFHPERGTVTLDGMLAIYAGHGAKHCGQILGLRERMRW
ncbi:MAG: putative metal-dependent hydrolase [Bacteroidetes bacterium]|nr:MAG: putative metal-dependent hydrolase [Bacteroidota bacterium]